MKKKWNPQRKRWDQPVYSYRRWKEQVELYEQRARDDLIPYLGLAVFLILVMSYQVYKTM